jgi:hypothetical protein
MKVVRLRNSAFANSAPRNFLNLSLWLGFLYPLLSSLVAVPRLRGLEALPIFIAWILSRRHSSVSNHEWFLPLTLCFLSFTILSTLANTKQLAALFFSLALLFPILVLPGVLNNLGIEDLHSLRKSLYLLFFVQLLFCLFQLLLRDSESFDWAQGTLLGTGAGAHITPFFMITFSTLLYGTTRRKFHLLIMFISWIISILGDAKQVVVVMIVSIGLTSIITIFKQSSNSLRIRKTSKLASLVLLTFVAIFLGTYLTTGFGGISGKGFIKLGLERKGGKIAIARELFNPKSEFWTNENILIGAGPASTISRAANLTVPGYLGEAPASKFGIEAAEYAGYFSQVASKEGFVGVSSITSSASGLMGVLGDFGLFSFSIFVILLFLVLRRIPPSAHQIKTWFSSKILFFVFFIFLGFFGEWIEFPIGVLTLLLSIFIFSETNFDRLRASNVPR